MLMADADRIGKQILRCPVSRHRSHFFAEILTNLRIFCKQCRESRHLGAYLTNNYGRIEIYL
jgi:hypothetical protein